MIKKLWSVKKMYMATCTHTIHNPCKHYKKQHKNCKKRPQTKSCHNTPTKGCKECNHKEECDLIISYTEYPKLLQLRQERLELLQRLRFLEADKTQYYQIKTMIEKKGSNKEVHEIINLNINQIETDLEETREKLKIIENGPYHNGRFDKTQSYRELMKDAHKKALKRIMKM